MDVDLKIIEDPAPLYELCTQNKGVFLVIDNDLLSHACKYWTKRDIFHFMDMDRQEYYDAPITLGGIQLYQKNEFSRNFLEELLYWCTYTPSMLTDDANICGKPNLDGFVEHRHDQSILSLLRLKYGIEGYRIPAQYGDQHKIKAIRKSTDWLAEGKYSEDVFENSLYGTILFHGRESNRFKYWIKYKIPSLIRYFINKFKNY